MRNSFKQSVHAMFSICALVATLGVSVHADEASPVPKTAAKIGTTRLDVSQEEVALVTLDVNGKRRVLQIDTGNPFSVLSEDVAKEDKIGSRLTPILGETLAVAPEVSVSVGSLQLTVPFVIVPRDQFASTLGNHVDGIFGADVLQYFTTILDFPGHRMTLLFPSDLSPEQVKSLGFGDAVRLATTDPKREGLHVVTATFNQKGRQSSGSLLFDTGAQRSILPAAAVRDLGLKPKGDMMAKTLKGSFIIHHSTLEKLQVAGLTFSNLDVFYSDKDAGIFMPALGIDALFHSRIMLNYSQHTIWMK